VLDASDAAASTTEKLFDDLLKHRTAGLTTSWQPPVTALGKPFSERQQKPAHAIDAKPNHFSSRVADPTCRRHAVDQR
jgi:hypothetical protein